MSVFTLDKLKRASEKIKLNAEYPTAKHYWVSNHDPNLASRVTATGQDLLTELLGPPKVIYSVNVLVDDETRRMFPVSKNRSKRIHKKLVKRFGGEFAKKPAIFQMGKGLAKTILAHPAFKKDLDPVVLNDFNPYK